MPGVPTYVNQLMTRQVVASGPLGAYLPGMTADHRVVLSLADAATAALAKLLVDKGIITDAELMGALDAALLTAFTPVEQKPQMPEVTEGLA